MLQLDLLGRIALHDAEGHEVDVLLKQPKRLALLSYLALPAPGAWHRRDTLLALFWPDLDTSRARTALRNALYVLRRALGEATVRSRGDEEVSLDPDRIRCDASDLIQLAQSGRFEEASEAYRGDLLPGLYVTGSGGFESWVDEQRRWIRELARTASHRASEDRERAGDPAGAARLAERGLAIDPTDEPGLRRLVTLLDQAGDRAGAVSAYERFRQRLAAEFEAEPDPETVALVGQVKARRERAGGQAAAGAADVSGSPGPRETHPSEAASLRPAVGVRWLYPVAALALTVLGVTVMFRQREPPPPAALPSIVVLPIENGTGYQDLDYLAAGLGEDLVSRLRQVAGVSVLSAVSGAWIIRPGQQPLAVARSLGGDLAFAGRLDRSGDGLRLVVRLIDAKSERQTWTGVISVDSTRLADAESQLVAGVAGAVLGGTVSPRTTGGAADPESYRLTLRGWYHMFTNGGELTARDEFLAALDRDPLNARAWSGLSSVWASLALTGRMPADEAWTRSEVAARRALSIDSTQGTALANLGLILAIRDGDAAGGERMIRRAIAFEPANAELHSAILATVYRLDGQLARSVDELRIGQQLDPVSPYFLGRVGFGLLCAGRPAEALAAYRSALGLDPMAVQAQRGVVRSLARLGRWDDALAAWRLSGPPASDSGIAEELNRARGEAGYWAVRHAEGRRLVNSLLVRRQEGWVSPGRLGMAYLQAGDLPRGLALIEEDIRGGSVQVYHLGCHEAADEYREAPGIRRLLETYGKLGTAGRLLAGGRVSSDSAQ